MEYMVDTKHYFPGLYLLLFFGMGAVVGSFLNVCILRIPAGLSIIPKSRCSCGAAIPWHKNIPILGWLIIRGRASCCGAKVSIRYPLVELLSAVLVCLSGWLMPPEQAIIGVAFTFILIAVAFIDYDTLEIPDRFSLGGVIVGVGAAIWYPPLLLESPDPIMQVARIDAFFTSLQGAAVGAGSFYLVSSFGYAALRKDAMGEGDVKLAACIGAFCGWESAIFTLFAGAIAGIALFPFLRWAQKFKDWDEDEDGAVPFGPGMVIAGWMYFVGWDFGVFSKIGF